MAAAGVCPLLIASVLALLPGLGHADDPWTPGFRFGGPGATVGREAKSITAQSGLAGLMPKSLLIAQAGGSSVETSTGEWRLAIAPSVWAPRTEIDLTLGDFSRAASLDFSEVVDGLRFGITTHFEATRGKWALLLDVLYFKLEKEGPTEAGVPTEVDFEEVFVEVGGAYRLATLPVGRTGRIAFEGMAGARLMYVDAELTIGAQRRLRTATLADPMFGGRIAYHITDTVTLWFRGDAAGFGISESQSRLTYNLVAGLSWRFTHVASVFAGWRYLHVDIEKGSGASTFDADLSMNGAFLGLDFTF